MPQDVYAAMKELEFEFMLPRLEAEVTKFTSIQADKRNTYRKKVRDEKKAAKDPQAPNDTGAAAEDSPPTKRARRSSADNGEHHSGSDDEVEGDETVDVEDEEVEDDDVDVEDEVPEEGLTEDLLEEPATRDEDDDMGDGDESD
jgi:DNA polymerase epsilon subunit 3